MILSFVFMLVFLPVIKTIGLAAEAYHIETEKEDVNSWYNSNKKKGN